MTVPPVVLGAPDNTPAPAVESTLKRPAVMVRDTVNVALLAVARAGDRLVAVGERGIIRLSDDNGKSWRQVQTPVSVSLTAVRFLDKNKGWAVGHRGVVLHTTDGGGTWVRQLDGEAIVALMSKFAQAQETQGGVDDESKRHVIAAARQIGKDGADKPLFDLHFADEKHGFVVGAYGIAMATTDGGQSWAPILDRIDNQRGLHLYSIQGSGNDLFLAGEQGLVLRSRDGGKTFLRMQTPYRGSYFALWTSPSGEVVAAGLNGNAYHSSDAGTTWVKLDIGTAASFSGFLALSDGTVLLCDQIGSIFASRDAGRSFKPYGPRSPLPLSAIARAADGSLTGVGLLGAVRLAAGPAEQPK